MKLSTRSRYGTRAILELALNYGKGMLTLDEIAKKQYIPKRYLERIMSMLVQAGLVTSLRGKNGGFSLARDPSNIRLSEVIKVLEGSLSLVACVENPKLCKLISVCVTIEIWKKIRKAILDVLDSITLQDIIKMQENKYKKSAPIEYSI